jgi:hypothetical protein
MREPEAFSLGTLYAAAMRAGRGKRRRAPGARFLLELEPALCALRDELAAGTWRPGVPRLLAVRDRSRGRYSVAPFRDRVVHQALAAVLAPRIERRLVGDCHACRPDRGTHAALARGRAWAHATTRSSLHSSPPIIPSRGCATSAGHSRGRRV